MCVCVCVCVCVHARVCDAQRVRACERMSILRARLHVSACMHASYTKVCQIGCVLHHTCIVYPINDMIQQLRATSMIPHSQAVAPLTRYVPRYRYGYRYRYRRLPALPCRPTCCSLARSLAIRSLRMHPNTSHVFVCRSCFV